MMNSMIKKLLQLVLFLLCVIRYPIFSASDKVGTTTGQFLNIDIGAAGIGMGGAYVSNEGSVDSIYWNPAGIGAVEISQISFMYSNWLSIAGYSNILAVYPVGKFGTAGLMLNFLSVKTIEGFDDWGFSSGETYNPTDMAVSLSWAKHFSSMLKPGVNVKFIDCKLTGEISGSAVAFDVGNQFEFIDKRLKAGFVVKNIGTKLRLGNSYSLPLKFTVGSMYRITDNIKVSFDVEIPSDDNVRILFGGEYFRKYRRYTVIGRCGYQTGNDGLSGIAGLSAGFGVRWKEYLFDYSWVPYGNLGVSHNMSISVQFGKKKKAVEKRSYIETPKASTKVEQINSFVAGNVVDIDGKPLQKVTIKVLKDGEEKERIFTNKDGVYNSEFFAPGKYVLKVWKRGYVPQQVVIEILKDKPIRADFKLLKKLK